MQFSRDATALLLLGLDQPTAHLFERLLGELLVRHINSRSNKPSKRSIAIYSRRSDSEHPAIGSIGAPQSAFRRKRLVILQRLGDRVQQILPIVWMYVAGPRVAESNRGVGPGEGDEPLIPIRDLAVGVAHPHQRRRGVRHHTEALLALTHNGLGLALSRALP